MAYPVEILPFSIRAKGMAVSSFAVQLALFFNSYVNIIALTAIGWKYYLVYVFWILIEVCYHLYEDNLFAFSSY